MPDGRWHTQDILRLMNSLLSHWAQGFSEIRAGKSSGRNVEKDERLCIKQLLKYSFLLHVQDNALRGFCHAARSTASSEMPSPRRS
jgi:hypothetical protein